MTLPYKNYIFDLYGTLADIRTDERRRELWVKTALYYTEHGAPYEAAELRREYLRLCRAEQGRHRAPLYEIELRKVFRALYAAKGVTPDRRRVEETAVFFRLVSLRKLRRYPWVAPVFSALRERGAGLFLLSNAQSCFTVPELRALGLLDAFDGIVISSDAHIKKPSPKVAHAAGMDALYLQTETSGVYDPALKAEYELLDGDFSRLPSLLGIH